jgi:hypothetical protein
MTSFHFGGRLWAAVLALNAVALAGCAAGPPPVTTEAAEASCLSAVEAQAGAGASVLRADRDGEKTVIFVTPGGGGAPYACSADISGRVTDLRQTRALI